MKVNTVVICAAGLGSRLGLDIPKCLVPIGKHKLIYYLLDLLKDIENIRVVVGFKEEEVISYVKSIRKDVVFVRNPNYNSTSNAYSLHLGSKDLDEPFMNIDGDMIIDPNDFKRLIEKTKEGKDFLVTTKAKTEDAVFIEVDNNDKAIRFSRDKISEHEWSGLAYFSSIRIPIDGNYVYQTLEPHLPLDTIDIKCWEVDTPSDLHNTLNELDFI